MIEPRVRDVARVCVQVENCAFVSFKRSELDLINFSSQKTSFLLECVTLLESCMSGDIANRFVRPFAPANAVLNSHTGSGLNKLKSLKCYFLICML